MRRLWLLLVVQCFKLLIFLFFVIVGVEEFETLKVFLRMNWTVVFVLLLLGFVLNHLAFLLTLLFILPLDYLRRSVQKFEFLHSLLDVLAGVFDLPDDRPQVRCEVFSSHIPHNLRLSVTSTSLLLLYLTVVSAFDVGLLRPVRLVLRAIQESELL